MLDYKALQEFRNWLIAVSLIGAITVAFICINLTDIRVLIAYSSVVHMALVLGGVVTMYSSGVYGSLILILGHGLCSRALFCLARILYERIFTRSIILLGGVRLFYPSLMAF